MGAKELGITGSVDDETSTHMRAGIELSLELGGRNY